MSTIAGTSTSITVGTSSANYSWDLNSKQYFVALRIVESQGDVALAQIRVFELSSEVIRHPPFLNIIAKENDDEERFIRGLSTHFPLIQNSFINARNTAYAEVNCEGVGLFGHVFNEDGSLHRGGGGRLDSESGAYSINLSDASDWRWEVNNRTVSLIYIPSENDSTLMRERYWDVLSVDDAGMALVLERSVRETQFGSGYLIMPRLNYMKLFDVSQLTEAYENGGFSGDFDEDSLIDGIDTDDDNDDLPDYFEESFSLNHRDASDRDTDNDGDGKVDLAIRRASSGSWVVRYSFTGEYIRVGFSSLMTDVPLATGILTRDSMTRAPSDNNNPEEIFFDFEVEFTTLVSVKRIEAPSNWKVEKVEAESASPLKY